MSTSFYNKNAHSFFEDTVNVSMNALYDSFLERLVPHAHILDAGCGSGRDTKAFLGLGYQVTAFDASEELAALAKRYTGQEVLVRTFDQVDEEACYDGIWACASLLHVPSCDLPPIMGKFGNSLKPGGSWYVSFKYGHGERNMDGRCFTDMDEIGLKALLAQLPSLSFGAMWTTKDKRPDREDKWINAILVKDG